MATADTGLAVVCDRLRTTLFRSRICRASEAQLARRDSCRRAAEGCSVCAAKVHRRKLRQVSDEVELADRSWRTTAMQSLMSAACLVGKCPCRWLPLTAPVGIRYRPRPSRERFACFRGLSRAPVQRRLSPANRALVKGTCHEVAHRIVRSDCRYLRLRLLAAVLRAKLRAACHGSGFCAGDLPTTGGATRSAHRCAAANDASRAAGSAATMRAVPATTSLRSLLLVRV